MKFKINGSVWNIVELSSEETQKNFNRNDGSYTFGYADYTKNLLCLNVEVPEVLRTLKHELMHVWMWETGHCQSDMKLGNEEVCEIVSSSIDFINAVVSQYIKGKVKKLDNKGKVRGNNKKVKSNRKTAK